MPEEQLGSHFGASCHRAGDADQAADLLGGHRSNLLGAGVGVERHEQLSARNELGHVR